MAISKQKVTIKIELIGQRSLTQLANVDNPLQKILANAILTDFNLDSGGSDSATPIDNTEYYDETGYSDETTEEEIEAIENPEYYQTPSGEYILIDQDNPDAFIPSEYTMPSSAPVVFVLTRNPRDITLQFTSVANATYYAIYYATDQFGKYILKSTSKTTTATVTGLYPGTTYWFKVEAKNDYGGGGLSDPVKGTTFTEAENGEEYQQDQEEAQPKTYVKHYLQIDDGEPHYIVQTDSTDPTLIAEINLTVYRGFRSIKYYNDDTYPWKVRIMVDGKRTSISHKNMAEVKVYIGKRVHFPVVQPVKRFANKTKTRATPLSGTGFIKNKKQKQA